MSSELRDEQRAHDRPSNLLLRSLVGLYDILVLLLAITGPFIWADDVRSRPLLGIFGAPIVTLAYLMMRHRGSKGSRGFGPLWLPMLDLFILLGNAGTFVYCCVMGILAIL